MPRTLTLGRPTQARRDVYAMMASLLRRALGLRRSRRRLIRKSEEGSLSTVLAIVLPFVVATVGAAADYHRMLERKVIVQAALDAAALGAVGDISKLTATQLTSKAGTLFKANVTAEINAATKLTVTADTKTSRLRLTASSTLPAAFMSIFGKTQLSVLVVSEAAAANADKPCVIALDSAASSTFAVSGNGAVKVPSCTIYVNSSSATALTRTGGSASISARNINLVGDYSRSMTVTPLPNVRQPVYPDPLAAVPEPTVPSTCTYTNMSVTSARTFPGGSVYCGNISFGGSVTFQPGIHYFKSATVTIQSNVNISGTGVMLYFDGNSVMSKASGGGQFALTGPSSGTYQGIALFGSRKGNKMQTFTLTGDKDYFVNGTIYLPTAKLSLLGSADLSVAAKSGYVIAKQLSYQGNSTFTMDNFGGPVPDAMKSSLTRLSR